MILAQQQKPFNNILISVCGVMFMAVPHIGSHVANIGACVASILKVVHIKEEFLKDLRPDSRSLLDISNAFSHLENFRIATVTEDCKTPIPGTGQSIEVNTILHCVQASS